MKKTTSALVMFCVSISLLLAKNQKTTLLTKLQKSTGLASINFNNIELQVDNNGIYGKGASYYPANSDIPILFDGGLMISAYQEIDGNDSLTISIQSVVGRMVDFLPGKWGGEPDDPRSDIYTVGIEDPRGGEAYLKWADAVSLGAEYIERDNVQGYDPNYDLPNIVGNRIFWTIYHDNFDNRSSRSKPVGLEIHQSIFGFYRKNSLGDILFFKYKLINKNDTDLKKVYFSAIDDPDIGNYTDDLAGCDTTLQLGYCYNDGDDEMYGTKPPAVGVALVQGPIAQSVGDTAYRFFGQYAGIDTLANYKNVPLSSYYALLSFYDYTGLLLEDLETARALQDGISWPGFDPPAQFIFTGDPVTNNGDIDTAPNDKKMILSSGPFSIAGGDTQEVILALVVGQGNNALSSITKLRENTKLAHNVVKHNFTIAVTPPTLQAHPRILNDKFQLLVDLSSGLNYREQVEYFYDMQFEGFQLIQWDRDICKTGISGASSSVVAFYDIKDSISDIYKTNNDGISIEPFHQGKNNIDLSQLDNSNPHILVEVDEDAFTNTPLIPYKTYYYSIVPFAVDVLSLDKIRGNSDYLTPFGGLTVGDMTEGFFSVTIGADENVVYNTIEEGSVIQHSGKSEGKIEIEVINPEEITANQYQVEFFGDGSYWRIINESLDQVLEDSLVTRSVDGNDWDYPIVDGMLVRLISPEDRIKDVTVSYDSLTPSNELWLEGQGTFSTTEFSVFNGGINYGKYVPELENNGLTELVTRDRYIPVKVVFDTVDQYLAYRYVSSNFIYRDTVRTSVAAYDMSDPGNPKQLNVLLKFMSPNKEKMDFLPANTDMIIISLSDYDESGQAYPDTTNGKFRDGYIAMNLALVNGTTLQNNPLEFSITPTYVPSDQDVYTIDASALEITRSVAEQKIMLKEVQVVPNPYIAFSGYETAVTEQVIKFTHLPEMVKIRIFDLSGQLVVSLSKNNTDSELRWDLRNGNGKRVASGLYIAHIEAPGVGTRILKFAVVQRK